MSGWNQIIYIQRDTESTVTKRHESEILNKIFAQYKLSSFQGNDILMADWRFLKEQKNLYLLCPIPQMLSRNHNLYKTNMFCSMFQYEISLTVTKYFGVRLPATVCAWRRWCWRARRGPSTRSTARASRTCSARRCGTRGCSASPSTGGSTRRRQTPPTPSPQTGSPGRRAPTRWY